MPSNSQVDRTQTPAGQQTTASGAGWDDDREPGQGAPPGAANRAESQINNIANRLVLGIARHWLAIFNLGWGSYIFLPLLAPLLMQAGLTGPAGMIYGIYSFTCHQLPDHSYFLFGPTATPQAPLLEAHGAPAAEYMFLFREFIGNAQIGYKVALCERDMAIYGSVFVAGLCFAFLRRRDLVRAPSVKVYLLFLIPLAVDGLTQLVGLRESNWWLRSVTGAIFGVASVWLAYPYIEDAMRDVVRTESAGQNRSASS